MNLAKRERELELERLALEIRDERIALDVERTGLSGTAGGKALVKRSISEGEEAAIEKLEQWKFTESQKRKRNSAYKYLNIMDSRTLLYVTARLAVNALAKKQLGYRGFVDQLADEVLMSIGATLFERKDDKEFQSLVRRLNWQPKVFLRKRMAHAEFQNHHIEVDATVQERLAIGTVLTELFCEATELFEVNTRWVNRAHSIKELRPTEKGELWVTHALSTNQIANPYHLPMVVPPYPWTNLYDGGYLLQNLHPATLVRTKTNKMHPSVEAADLSQVMKAVNAIQETPWQINKPILEVWRQLVGTGLAGCSTDKEFTIPKRLPEDHPKFQERQNERRNTFEARRDNTAKKCVEIQKARMAEILEQESELYYPHNLDFRGRIYPLAGRGAINPQGDDSGKALLRFANGKRLGEDGVQWLFIHTQNCWGNDKVSLQRRIDDTSENLELYSTFATDPMQFTGWMQADKPFCFLACCYEIKGYLEQGEDFVSHLPIALDGSCSGLQHFAGIMKDQSTAEAVNVVPSGGGDKSADVYTKIAEGVTEHLILEDGRESTGPYASYWRNLVSRDVVKQPVMTLSYGVTTTGMRNQIREKCKKLVRKGKLEYKAGTQNDYAAYLADVIRFVIGDVASAAFDVMDWLAEAAKVKAETVHGLEGALSWTTPVGLPVIQEYYDYESQQFNVFVEGREIRFKHRTGPAAVRKIKQKQGAAPNFVHSMDASHLMLTVNACVEYGIKNFAMIHDSFGTHAADTGTLFEVLRQEFALMYEHNWLMQLFREMPIETRLNLDMPPKRGDLELSRVQDSEFFFA